MPKIIFKCRYLKSGEHAGNLVEYMGTREGVEKLPPQIRIKSATDKQRNMITDLLRQFPDTADLFEYKDYLEKSTVENASEFITAAYEQNMDQLGHQDVYVKYIATRPHVEKAGVHGLFSDAGSPIVLSRVVDEIAHHGGNVWTPIISLRREDAVRLGYNNAAAWMNLLRGKRNLFAEQMKISPENLRWYAAFHNEGHHPHCHMVVYSADPREGYVTKPAIEKMRSTLAHEIFKQDLIQTYQEQTGVRQKTAEQCRAVLTERISQMESGACESPAIENLLVQLSERLRHISGKKQYGYLKADVKALVDRIVDELAKDSRVAEAYAVWLDLRNEVLRTYADKFPEPLPLSAQKEFKNIRNMVIMEAMRVGDHTITFEGDECMDARPDTNEPDNSESVAIPEDAVDSSADLNEEAERPSDLAAASTSDHGEDKGAGHSAVPHIEWNDRYMQARESLYGNENAEPDFARALRLFQEEAATGNVLAMCDLGRMYKDGFGTDVSVERSFEWYEQALNGFYEIESAKAHRYIEYRIGSMHARGLGTEQDYEEAAGWLEKSATENYKYAQYSLAGLYVRGQGVTKNLDTAFQLYEKAARQHFPYASYELAKMCRDGLGTAIDHAKAGEYFREAFLGFLQLEKQSRNDRLLYRIGQMLYTGTGTAKDIGASIPYLERSAKLGNGYAQYQLGKLYRDGRHVAKDMDKAVALFTVAAEQRNSFAAYALGKLHLAGEGIPKDVDSAVSWLTASAEQNNQYAQYALGKLYLLGQDVPPDREKAVRWLEASANQGNPYARFLLDHPDSFHNPSLFLAAMRLMRQLSRIFQDQQERLRSPHTELDSKLRRRLRQKKIAMGHAAEEQSPSQIH